MFDLVKEKKEKSFTTSRIIAKHFNKNHQHVLRDIKNLDCSEDFRLSNYGLSKYNSRGKEYPEYILTRDGLVFLVMGYTGKEAAKLKEDYINAFNSMEAYIKSKTEAKIGYRPMTDAIAQDHEDIKPYHFSNEADMINRIVLGMTAKKYKETFRIDLNENLRPHLKQWELKAINHLQQINTGLIYAVFSFQDRKEMLIKAYCNRPQHLLKGE